MKLVIHTSYYDYCDYWDHERYIEYSSAEKFLCDFEEWCKTATEYETGGFLGLELYRRNLLGDDQYSQVEIYTYDEWWENKLQRVKEK